jgi:flagellin
MEKTDMGSMTLQIGAHENQTVDVRIPAATCEALYIDDLNLVRKNGASQAIVALDDAIAQVSEIRSRLGAYQNRLEYATSSLDTTQENMESAISRIMDTDMAEEMTTYANLNVLDQAAISVLTQANDMPQQILQLLN